jgi:hypothetical protein
MPGFARTAIGALFIRMIPVVTLALFMGATAASAELLLQLDDDWSGTPVPGVSRQTVRKPADLLLNSNGGLAIRRRDFSLTLAYVLSKESIEPQEQLSIVQRQNFPSISGISFKLSLQF